MVKGGQCLRKIRERMGLTVRDVQEASERLASKHGNPALFINKARLSDIESKGVLPNIFKLYSMAAIYRRSLSDLLACYGLQLNELPADMAQAQIPKTHLASLPEVTEFHMPTHMVPTFDIRETTDFGRLIARWGTVPLAFLSRFERSKFSFGYIGTEDWSMFPLLLPGSFVQIDESKRKIVERVWGSEYQRPIYFVETRDRFLCGWCSVEQSNLIVQPHPMSAQRVRVFREGSEAEVLGQVVAFAMRLDQFEVSEPPQFSQVRTTSTPDV